MKRIALVVAAIFAVSACSNAAKEKATADSIEAARVADSTKMAMDKMAADKMAADKAAAAKKAASKSKTGSKTKSKM